jgi:hypothetical protein
MLQRTPPRAAPSCRRFYGVLQVFYVITATGEKMASVVLSE